jgi:hypothetical protein
VRAANATNLGLALMAASCGIAYDVLAWTRWCVREETLRAVSLGSRSRCARWRISLGRAFSLSAVRGAGCGLEQFDEVAGGVGEQDLASAGAGHRGASEGQSSGA